ncbi:Serine/threonine-protein kinase ssp1 [Pseudozyma hubeiensis]|nr:Serine/threonine-protein kinase ssp1 [Pseudozyma hubeiensis]
MSPILPDREIGFFSSAELSRSKTNKQIIPTEFETKVHARRQWTQLETVVKIRCLSSWLDAIDLASVCMTMRKRRMWDAGLALVECSVDRDGGQGAERN